MSGSSVEPALLHTDNLDAFYGAFQALFGVSIRFVPGQTVALIGANGAGKTTLLKALVGAVSARRDGVLLDGKPVGGDAERVQLARGIALVPEGRRLFASLTVEENLLVAARNGRPGPWNIARVLQALPTLRSLMNRSSLALSGGQQQLVAIARAMVSNPSFMLCDEISLGLSPQAIDDAYGLLSAARSEGVAIVLVEQNVQRAVAESDRYACLQKGRLVLEGPSAGADMCAIERAYFGF